MHTIHNIICTYILVCCDLLNSDLCNSIKTDLLCKICSCDAPKYSRLSMKPQGFTRWDEDIVGMEHLQFLKVVNASCGNLLYYWWMPCQVWKNNENQSKATCQIIRLLFADTLLVNLEVRCMIERTVWKFSMENKQEDWWFMVVLQLLICHVSIKPHTGPWKLYITPCYCLNKF